MIRAKRPLFLHKDEWNRLKSIGEPTPQCNETNKYIQSLIEKSQNWINSWPDSVQSHISKLAKLKEKQHRKDLAMVKSFKKQQKDLIRKNECIEKAKEMIFDDSSYGRQLISALLESKALEERDVQIEFLQNIRQKAQEDMQQNAIGCSLKNATVMEQQDRAQETRKREIDKEVAQVNKTMFLDQSNRKEKEKEKQKQMEIEDKRLMEQLIQEENAQEIKKKSLLNQELQQFIVDQKQLKEEKAMREDEDERKRELWRKYDERQKSMMEMIHKKRFEKTNETTNYELVKKLNEDEKDRYDEFVNKGIESHMRKLQIKEEADNRKQENERKTQYILKQSNKKLADSKRVVETDVKKCTCDRQLITNTENCKNIRGTKQVLREQETYSFTTRNNKLLKNLKVKEKEPSPWSGVPAAHAQFARRAANTLRQCRYKLAARQVVNDYRRLNGLTEESLPIPNYY